MGVEGRGRASKPEDWRRRAEIFEYGTQELRKREKGKLSDFSPIFPLSFLFTHETWRGAARGRL
jgi:hypothetical protein